MCTYHTCTQQSRERSLERFTKAANLAKNSGNNLFAWYNTHMAKNTQFLMFTGDGWRLHGGMIHFATILTLLIPPQLLSKWVISLQAHSWAFFLYAISCTSVATSCNSVQYLLLWQIKVKPSTCPVSHKINQHTNPQQSQLPRLAYDVH